MDRYSERNDRRETSRQHLNTGAAGTRQTAQSCTGSAAGSSRTGSAAGSSRTGSAAGSSRTRNSAGNSRARSSAGSRRTQAGSSRQASIAASDPRFRARQAARRRRRRRQRRILIGIMALLLLLIAGGIFAGVRQLGKGRARNQLRSEGIAAMESGDYQTAVEKFDEALALSGKKAGTFETDVLQYRGEASYNLGDYAGSLQIWQQLLEQDKENQQYKENAVLCMLETGDYDGALAIGVLQNRIYNRMALKAIEEEDYDQALTDIDMGMAADDGSMAADLAFNQAVAYEGKRDFQKALELFEAYAANYGMDETVQREITFLQSRQGNEPEPALEDPEEPEVPSSEASQEAVSETAA